MAPPRILLCGDPVGHLNQLFKRVSSVNKSAGPFDALLCVGQFFPDSSDRLEELTEYVDGRKNIPLPTYFIGDYGAGAVKVLTAAAKESCNLGFKMDGLKIRDNLFWLKGSGKFVLHGLTVAYLSGRKSSSGVIASTSDIPPGISDSSGSDDTISELVAEIKPRYHVAGSKGVFYAREPYMNADAAHVTRFIGLAAVGNASKQANVKEVKVAALSTVCRKAGWYISKECWFCLSSPNVESHLITSVGENFYCALAKGPLVQDHVLILPIEHLPNTLSSPPEFEIELVKFQNSLKAYFKSRKKEVVFFEWVYLKTSHANLQVLAGLLNMADRADWRNCKLDKEEEIKMVERFKSSFQEYDPNQ
ncbi:hypothetical protein M8C21_028982 [Ambrosia artemisiifolia]|uniref:Cwf19-like C-terminal domain-containing protein n=1 Tax=Ambrosia artemisiifolia TaxID=4212 RepID=A0AAD5BK27_AMBAR|nr:hypothetical protein M8C21_028982 [Ambrosia artemisiifolia]